MRGGKPGGGKGTLIGNDLSHTLGTGNDQTIVSILPEKPIIQCVDTRQVEAHETEISPTLTATDYKGGKAVYGIGRDVFNASQNAKYALGLGDDVQPTMTSRGPGAVCYENNPTDSRIKETSVAPTCVARWGTGGNNMPLVQGSDGDIASTLVATMFTKNTSDDCTKLIIEQNPVSFIKNDAGGDQQGFWDETSPTLRSGAMPTVAYNVTFCDANGTRKDRPNGGLYVTEAETSKTITVNGTNTETVVVGSVAIAENIIGRQVHTGGNGVGAQSEVAYTQNTTGVMGVATMERPRIWTIDPERSNSMKSSNPNSGIHETDVAKTLDTGIPTPHKAQGGQMILNECVPLDLRNATRDPNKKDEQNRQGVGVGEDGAPMSTITTGSVPGVGWKATVRRLLPVECERLMGFPDNHTRIKWKGKSEEECPDAPRYKVAGNSMAVNVMAWIGHRIQEVEERIQKEKK
jgi:site-specific DNA-cytosine methylase